MLKELDKNSDELVTLQEYRGAYCMYTFICVHVCMYVCMCVHVCVCVCVCVCTMYTLPCTYVPGSHTYMSTSRVQHPIDQLND